MSKRLIIVLGFIICSLTLLGAGCEKRGSESSQAPGQPETVAPYAQDQGTEAKQESPQAPSTQSPTEITFKNNMHMITLSTNFGDIQFTTYDADAPKTVKNFITLAQKGFYEKLTFHRVIKGFMIQGGDPSGNGTGGPGYTFEDELNPATESYKNGYKRGVLAMANAGPNTNGSQFFIMHQDYPLPNSYSIFGKVVKGQEAVDAIASAPTDSNDKPAKSVVIQSVKVEEVK